LEIEVCYVSSAVGSGIRPLKAVCDLNSPLRSVDRMVSVSSEYEL
jgi:hypothetical protein